MTSSNATDGRSIDSADVVVVGMGAAGLAAAITAHDAGAEVVVLEKMPPEHAGGNSRVSGQVWFSPVDAGAARTHLRALSWEYPVPEPVVGTWAEETSANSDWVRARAEEVRGTVPRDVGDPYTGDGTDFSRIPYADIVGVTGMPRDEYYEVEGNECGTEYCVIGGSMGFSRLWLVLKACLDRRAIPVRYGTAVNALIRDVDGGITGVTATGPEGTTHTVTARRGVILASGGFAANPAMAANYLRLSHVTPWGSPACTGDGIKMAQKVGADLAHPYNYMAMPGIEMPPYETGESGVPGGERCINVGADGRRFIDESLGTRHGKTRMRGMFDFYPGFPMWTVFDEDGRVAGPLVVPRPYFAISWMKQIEHYDWSADNSAEIERGWITKADSIGALADKLEIDRAGLEDEVERYNGWVLSSTGDPVFGRPADTMHPIARAPFYGYRWAQLLITTLGGVRKDEHAGALDPQGAPIPGLYCAGDVSSTYTWCLSGGMGIGDAMAFGRVAGRNAAARGATAGEARGGPLAGSAETSDEVVTTVS